MTNLNALRVGYRLSPREYDALALVAHGYSNATIGRALGVTEDTAKTHVRKMLARLGAKDRAHAVAIAYETGILQPGHLTGDTTTRPTIEQRVDALERFVSRLAQNPNATIGRAS